MLFSKSTSVMFRKTIEQDTARIYEGNDSVYKRILCAIYICSRKEWFHAEIYGYITVSLHCCFAFVL